MTTVQFRSSTIAVVAVLTLAGSVAAQEKPSGLLNSVEVQQLVKRADRSDNARLAAHFTALADRYAAEAKRHLSMAQSFVANANRNLATGMSAHCKQLADLNTRSATELRELAAYHQKLTSGVTATPPAGGARFERGAGAPAPTEQELNAMAVRASSPADHRALEAYFLTLAKRYTGDAADHKAMASAYRGLPRSPGWAAGAAAHCDRLATLSGELASEAAGAAAMHQQLAGVGR
jgi:hypothetical protein